MIIESSQLKKILDILYVDYRDSYLEISSESGLLHVGINYGDNYYIEYNIEDEIEEEFSMVMSSETLIKIRQLVNLWPKSSLQVSYEGEHQILEIIDYGKLTREKPVQVDCVFEKSQKDYEMFPPEMKPSLSVNAKNLKQMLEFCQIQDRDIILTLDSDSLIINNYNKTLGTRVEVEELFETKIKTMKLSAEANQLIISFLNNLGIKVSYVYLVFMEREYAFSIRVKMSEKETIQIYTIHL